MAFVGADKFSEIYITLHYIAAGSEIIACIAAYSKFIACITAYSKVVACIEVISCIATYSKVVACITANSKISFSANTYEIRILKTIILHYLTSLHNKVIIKSRKLVSCVT